jgi:error-prone DNA polymerase
MMRGCSSLEALCLAARERGMQALAITDIDGLYGAVRFFEIARDLGLRPILGAEVTAADPRGRAAGESATVLVRSRDGYAALCRILTRRHLDPAFSLPSALAAAPEGLVVLTSSPDLLKTIREARGPEGLRLALGASGAGRSAASGGLERLREARRMGIAPVAVNDVHFVDARDYDLHRMLRAIARNTTRDRVPPEDLAPPQAWLKPPSEMERAYPHCPEAVAETIRLADDCALASPPWGELVFPRYADMVPDAPEDTFALLGARCEEGARARYGAVTPPVRARLDHELAIIREKGFADYFLVVQEIVKRSPRTAGRGSGAASIVSYCLGITQVEPLRHNLYFERFLNRGRVDPPDIDVDFCWDERDGVVDWVLGAFGKERAAMIANHVTFRARAAVREVAKVYGLPEGEIKKVTDRLSLHWQAETAEEATARDPLFRGEDMDPGRGGLLGRPPWPEILAWATRLEGCPRHLSVHCGGVVMAPDGIGRHVPVEKSAKGVNVIQWEKDQAEEAGLVKIDLLGNRSLSVIRDACVAVRQTGGPELRLDAGVPCDPIDDPRTQELMRDGDTMGVFYVESPAMRQLQQKTRRGDFEHLVIHSSIIRPAANEYIREYVRRLRGGEYEPLHPILDDVLRETYGIMCYQEDVARVAIRMAGFTDSEADGLRKVLSKKWTGHRVEDYGRSFARGAAERGISPEVTDAVWRMILSFSGYSFCKPHSASYALVSFMSGYLKAHHPAEFMAAVLGNGGGYYSAFAYVSECRRMGLEVRPPDINESGRAWTGRSARPADGPDLGTGGPAASVRGWVRVGLQQIKGLKEEAAGAILKERDRRGPFLSLDDVLARVALDPGDAVLLVRAGAFDRTGFGAEDAGRDPATGSGTAALALRPRLHWRLRAWEAAIAGRRARERPLFAPDLGPLPEPRPYDEAKLLRDEVETLGFLVSRHPLTLYRDALLALRREGIRPVRGANLPHHVGRRVAAIGWLITGKVVTTKDDLPMQFVSFEDTTAIYETTFFPRTYDRFCHMLTTARPYLLRGLVEEDFGAVTVTVDEVAFLDGAATRRSVRTGGGAGLSGGARAALHPVAKGPNYRAGSVTGPRGRGRHA